MRYILMKYIRAVEFSVFLTCFMRETLNILQ